MIAILIILVILPLGLVGYIVDRQREEQEKNGHRDDILI